MSTIEIPIDRGSEAYRRVTAAGFKISKMVKSYDVFYDSPRTCILFQCVCGRQEVLQNTVEERYHDPLFNKEGEYDAALAIERVGALGEEHLRKDGFSEADIKRIRMPYELEKLRKQVKTMKDIMLSARGESILSMVTHYGESLE